MTENRKAALKDKFANEETPIQVIGRHLDVTDAMKAYAVEKLLKASRFGVRVIDITIVMDIQKMTHVVDFILNINNTKVKVSGKTENMYVSIDQAIDHLETKLRRYHKRLTEHHSKGIKSLNTKVTVVRPSPAETLNEINDQIEEINLETVEENLKPHEIVRQDTFPLKTLTQSEAIMKLELSGDHFLLFKSEEDRKLKVVYRLDDANYGIIEPE